MSDIVVATLPIKPQKETNVGMLIAPSIMDYLGTCLDAERAMNINELNTYHDKSDDIGGYVETLDKSKISYDSLYIDTEYADKILNIIDILYTKGYIKKSYQNVIRCECGCVDMLTQSVNSNAKLYERKEDKIYCKKCNSECKTYNEEVLLFNLDEKVDDDVSITPAFLKKEMNAFSPSFKGRNILVSKSRNTGFKYLDFNVDVDFLWLNYFNMFKEDNQVLIASNHQLFIMYLMNYISHITSDKKIHFIATPYMRGSLSLALQRFNSKDFESYKKLFILYNLKWNQKDCTWSDTVFQYLNGISETKLNNLYRAMLYDAKAFLKEYKTLDETINHDLVKSTNMQENIKLMKKLYKEGVI